MDRNELLNDMEEGMRAVLDGRQSVTWTAMPGLVTAIDFPSMTCTVQPTIQGSLLNETGAVESVDLPLLLDVPIVFQGGGGFLQTFPLAVNDEVLVVFASRCIDAWWESGGIQKPAEARMHDLSDGFAIPNPRSKPNVVSGISTSKAVLRNNAGTVYFSMGSKFSMTNAVTDLKTALVDFETAVNTFMGVLAGFSGGGVPVTQAMLQSPAVACQTALAAVLVKFGALLE